MTEQELKKENIVGAGRILACEIDGCHMSASGYAENAEEFKIWLCLKHYPIATAKMLEESSEPIPQIKGPLFAGA